MQYDERGESVAQVYVALPQIRADRRKVKPLPMLSHAKCTASQVLQLLSTDHIVSMQHRDEASPHHLAAAMASDKWLSEEGAMKIRSGSIPTLSQSSALCRIVWRPALSSWQQQWPQQSGCQKRAA